jgi:hypothetical protein
MSADFEIEFNCEKLHLIDLHELAEDIVRFHIYVKIQCQLKNSTEFKEFDYELITNCEYDDNERIFDIRISSKKIHLLTLSDNDENTIYGLTWNSLTFETLLYKIVNLTLKGLFF